MSSQRFRGVIAAGPRGSAVIMVPFDPDEAWGAKADHPVTGTVGDCRTRTRLVPAGREWVLVVPLKRLISMGMAIGDEVSVELAPEGPQRGDLAADIGRVRRRPRREPARCADGRRGYLRRQQLGGRFPVLDHPGEEGLPGGRGLIDLASVGIFAYQPMAEPDTRVSGG